MWVKAAEEISAQRMVVAWEKCKGRVCSQGAIGDIHGSDAQLKDW